MNDVNLTDEDRQRIAGRKWAEEVIEVALESGKDFHEGFVRQLRRVYKAKQEEIPHLVMTEAEAIAFEAQQITFGKYAGETYGTAPREYVAWLMDRNLALFKYVNSTRFKEREF